MKRTRPLSSLLVLAMTALPALAQSEMKPPKITESPSAPRFWMYAVLLLLTGALVFAATLKPKRTHQD